MDFKTSFLRMIRLTPDWLDCDNATFIANAYRDCLGRNPEFDPVESVAMMPLGDVYEARTTYLRHLVGSEESRKRGHAAMVESVATFLGTQYHSSVASMVDACYPSMESLVEGLETLMVHVCDNSRRQQQILALAAI